MRSENYFIQQAQILAADYFIQTSYEKCEFVSKYLFSEEVEMPFIVSSDFEVDDNRYVANVTMQVGGMACIIKWIDWYIDDVMVQSQPPNFIAANQVWAPFVDMAEFGDICSYTTIYAGIRFLEQDSVLPNHLSYFKNQTISPCEYY